ncbi:MAG: DUF1398 domain-containing protein [Acidimicrobiales bacterium]
MITRSARGVRGWRALDYLAADRGVCTLDATERAANASVASVFTIEQIEELHARFGNAETLADYVRSLAALGVARYDSFVSDGHSEYLGRDAQRATSHAVHDQLTIAESSDRDALLDHLRRHEQGETSYVEMSEGLAASGIERWTVDTSAMSMTFYNRSGYAVRVEQIM